MKDFDVWCCDEPDSVGGNVKTCVTIYQLKALYEVLPATKYPTFEAFFADWLVVNWAYKKE